MKADKPNEQRVVFHAPLAGVHLADPAASDPGGSERERQQREAAELERQQRELRQQQDQQRLEETLAMLEDEVRQLEERRAASLGELQQAAVELAVTVAAQIVGESIDAGQFAVEDKVRTLIGQMSSDGPLIVRLNPADLELLNERIQRLSIRWPQGCEMQLEGDASVGRGACQVDGQAYSLVTDVESQLTEIRQALLEIAQDAQIERRSHAAGSQAVRRYPDRRQTA